MHQKNLTVFNANLKNSGFRLGNSWIIINKRSSTLDLLYVTPESIIYCEVDGENYSVSEKYAIPYAIINKHIEAFGINIGLIYENSLTLVVNNIHLIQNRP